MNVLALSAFYHEAAACLLKDGKVVAAFTEASLTGKRNEYRFPKTAVRRCLEEENLQIQDIDLVGFYSKPFVGQTALFNAYRPAFPWSLPAFLRALRYSRNETKWIPRALRDQLGYQGPIRFVHHAVADAANAFYASPFSEAAVICMHNTGVWSEAVRADGAGTEISVRETRVNPRDPKNVNRAAILGAEQVLPHQSRGDVRPSGRPALDRTSHFVAALSTNLSALDRLYEDFGRYLGFMGPDKINQIRACAVEGEPRYAKQIMDRLIDLEEDGRFSLRKKFLKSGSSDRKVDSFLEHLFGEPSRPADGRIETIHRDIAASIQLAIENVLIRICAALLADANWNNLVFSGFSYRERSGRRLVSKIRRHARIKDVSFVCVEDALQGVSGTAGFIYVNYLNGDRDAFDISLLSRNIGKASLSEEQERYEDASLVAM